MTYEPSALPFDVPQRTTNLAVGCYSTVTVAVLSEKQNPLGKTRRSRHDIYAMNQEQETCRTCDNTDELCA